MGRRAQLRGRGPHRAERGRTERARSRHVRRIGDRRPQSAAQRRGRRACKSSSGLPKNPRATFLTRGFASARARKELRLSFHHGGAPVGARKGPAKMPGLLGSGQLPAIPASHAGPSAPAPPFPVALVATATSIGLLPTKSIRLVDLLSIAPPRRQPTGRRTRIERPTDARSRFPQ